ncbi:hypothetical protein [Fictibacillus sp. KU28468]|uniref:hypothetical protein n=1 Tax=Fictibacillus sp. KU28468 TaxID=2991053 RepID=UPI00223C93AF|nr:hypothetical protein [Fictibacillus sp. KU28468]UZJ76824.1 hypothetical protein OKX00_11385 [Fictibacillus sp. KU28468]
MDLQTSFEIFISSTHKLILKTKGKSDEEYTKRLADAGYALEAKNIDKSGADKVLLEI